VAAAFAQQLLRLLVHRRAYFFFSVQLNIHCTPNLSTRDPKESPWALYSSPPVAQGTGALVRSTSSVPSGRNDFTASVKIWSCTARYSALKASSCWKSSENAP
jgi:hypothetical protein